MDADGWELPEEPPDPFADPFGAPFGDLFGVDGPQEPDLNDLPLLPHGDAEGTDVADELEGGGTDDDGAAVADATALPALHQDADDHGGVAVPLDGETSGEPELWLPSGLASPASLLGPPPEDQLAVDPGSLEHAWSDLGVDPLVGFADPDLLGDGEPASEPWWKT